MSPSPGNGRLSRSPSPSPGPSQRSSHTLRSSASRESGEGSSRGPGTLDLTSIRHKANERPVSATYLGDNLIPERGEGSGRRKRPRTSGGFLLDNLFDRATEHASPRDPNRYISRQDHSPASRGSSKGKERAESVGANGTMRRPARRAERSASPPHREQNGSSPSNGSRPSRDAPRISVETSGDSSDRSPQDYRFSSDRENEPWHQPVAQPAAVDSAQLVQMALALSEGRRRHANTSLLTPPSTNAGRRTTSAGAPALQGGYNSVNVGGSLKKYLNEQRRISGNVSPSHGRSTPPGRHVSAAYSTIGPLDVGIGQPRINMSDATLARVEKVRAYIEMRSHYMRLLDYLPPLQPDSTAHGNTIVQTSSGPGGIVEMHRVPSQLRKRHDLGRQYNPLQIVRDRKLRARMRKPCNPDVEQWGDLDSVIDWVDEVGETARHASFREKDRVRLPQYLGGDCDQRVANGQARVESSTTGKLKKTRTDWHVHPEELFADAYWLEQGGHKGLVEDRHGNILFPGYAASHEETPRSSFQDEQRKPTPRDEKPRAESIAAAESIESTDVDSPEPARNRGRRRLFHRDREQSPGALRQLWHKRKERSPSSDGLSDTDDEYSGGRSKAKKRLPAADGEINIGPLERHMNSIVENLDQTGSPELASPGTPEKWGKAQSGLSDHRNGAAVNTPQKTPERASPQVLVHGDRADRKRPYPSLETAFDSSLDESAPNSPTTHKKAPSIAMNDPPSRDSSRAPEHKRRIPFLHHRAKDSSRLAPQDPYAADDSDARSSRQPSAETDLARPSLEDKQRPHPQQLGLWRTNDSLASSVGSRKDRGEKEPSSAVSRFFKGGRVGDLIRGERPEFMWKKEPLPEEVPSWSRSSDDESESPGEKPSSAARSGQLQSLSKTSSNTSWASRALDRRTANKPRYHVEGMPTFRSSQGQSTSTLQSAIDKARPSRFNLLNPSRTDTSGMSRTSTRETTSQPTYGTETNTSSFYAADRRSSYGFLEPNYHPRNLAVQSNGRLAPVPDNADAVGPGGFRVQRLRDDSRSASESPGRRPRPDGHRHWSISDPSNLIRQRSRSSAGAGRSRSRQRPTSPNVVSKVDMERVRTLLLCTGIKAHTMSGRASEVRPVERLDPLLHAVSRATGRRLVPVPRKEEHVLAARMLVDDFDGSVEGLRALADAFATRTTAELAGALDALKEVARDELGEWSRNLGDEAGGIAIRVTTKGTRDVQAISEAAQGVARARRRQMRWVRRMGWGMVEWLLLGIMWWVWLIVVVIRLVLRVLGGFGCVVKWLLFL